MPAAARDDIIAAVAGVAAALDRIPLAGAAAFIEVPAGDFTAAAARAVDDHRYRAKVRTRGTTAQAFPDDQTLASCLVTLAQARLAFKCTAGLHHAVRHRAADTGFEHHGFLNVLLAVAAALDDAPARNHRAHAVPGRAGARDMPPTSSASGGAHGVLSHAMSPVCEDTFDFMLRSSNLRLPSRCVTTL